MGPGRGLRPDRVRLLRAAGDTVDPRTERRITVGGAAATVLAGHVLGTDPLGNDILSRLLHGGQLSLIVGFCTNLAGIVLGGFIGILAGYKGGLIDATIMRVLDVLMAFPALVLAIVVANYLGPSLPNLIGTLTIFTVPLYARIARASTLKQREHIYISAARVVGQRDLSILIRHIAPNAAAPLLTASLLAFGVVIVVEATLSFLGLGIPPPEPTWGNMIARGQASLSTDPALVFVPSALLFLTVISLNLVGDAARRRWGSK